MFYQIMKEITHFFTPQSPFGEQEWLLRYQTQAMLVLSFWGALGLLGFAWVRYVEGKQGVALTQLLFAFFLLYGFVYLRRDKSFYQVYSLVLFIIFFLYIGMIFFWVPENRLNILWVIATPILIFFFLNKRGGVAMFLLVFGFILYLILSGYPYTVAEFITLLTVFFVTTFMMYVYEKVKAQETIRLIAYNQTLQAEVERQTYALFELNQNLQQRVLQEVQKQQAQEQMLLCQNRMANMGMMIDAIAHQWRQPLMQINAILLNISRISETEPHNITYIEEKIDNIAEITHHMSQTIHDFRDLFSPTKSKQYFSLEMVVEHILTLMQHNLKEIKVVCDNPPNLRLYGYQNELSQVLLILLQNAIEALQQHEVKAKAIQIRSYEDHKGYYLLIEDNAGGIDMADQNRIFEPYFSTKGDHAGTGLGLYIAKIIMERSFKGEIRVFNTLVGASFSLYLPKAEA